MGKPRRSEVHCDPTHVLQQASYMDLFDRSLDAIVLTDAEQFNVLASNFSFERLFEIPEDQVGSLVIQGNILQWLVQESRAEFELVLRRARKKYYSQEHYFHWLTHKGKKLWVKSNIGTLQLAQGSPVVQLILTDFTKQKQMED